VSLDKRTMIFLPKLLDAMEREGGAVAEAPEALVKVREALHKDPALLVALFPALLASGWRSVDDMPADGGKLPSLCSLALAVPADGPVPAALNKMLVAKEQALAAKYASLTGETLTLDLPWLASKGHSFFGQVLDKQLPRVSKLRARCIGLSTAPTWSQARYTAERDLMKTRTVVAPAPLSPTPLAAPVGGGRDDVTSTDVERDNGGEATAAASAPAASALATPCCNPRSIVDAATGTPPPDAEPGRGYTFPHRLASGEDIFYDYSVVIPVDCGCCKDKDATVDPCEEKSRNAAIRVLASLAQTMVEALRRAKIAGALGADALGNPVTADAISHLLTDCLVPLPTHSGMLHRRRQTLRELAGTLRLMSRLQLYAAPVLAAVDHSASLEGMAGNLNSAINALGHFKKQANTVIPWGLTGDDSADRAKYPSKGPNLENQPAGPLPESLAELLYYDDGVNPAITPPNAEWRWFGADMPGVFETGPHYTESDARGWVYLESYKGRPGGQYQQWNELTPYLKDLGARWAVIDQAKSGVETVAATINGVAGAIKNNATLPPQDQEVLTNLFLPLINEAAASLALILDQIADLVVVPAERASPNSKRLAMQLVFRQHWFPAGYVMGKLVGYKTLMPGESQQLKRRTFVKTSRESVSTSEFVSTRQSDYSQTRRDTSELVEEAAAKFNFKASVTGFVNFAVAGGEAKTEVGGDVTATAKAVHNTLAESVTKGSANYNDKRELKIRETIDTETSDEVVSEVRNVNNEITANYFYYQLLREYAVSSEFYDIRPVILVARPTPSPAEIDEQFIGRHLHVLSRALPAQLALDARETVNDISAQGRRVVRTRVEKNRASSALDELRKTLPAVLDDRSRTMMDKLESEARAAVAACIDAEETFDSTFHRLGRVVAHLRENTLAYMHHIWNDASNVDRDAELRLEKFCDDDLDTVTQGFTRIGYLGNEEIFEYTSRNPELVETLLNHLVSGTTIASRADGDVVKERLLERIMNLQKVDRAAAIAILSKASLVDESPGTPLDVDERVRRVQVVQDALVVEAMPGNVPLLEGFKLAHRMLDVEKACLENEHLRQRISDRPWTRDGAGEEYKVVRREGTAVEAKG
jgi:hypothetical protein